LGARRQEQTTVRESSRTADQENRRPGDNKKLREQGTRKHRTYDQENRIQTKNHGQVDNKRLRNKEKGTRRQKYPRSSGVRMSEKLENLKALKPRNRKKD